MEDLTEWRRNLQRAEEFAAALWPPHPLMEKVTRYLEMRQTFGSRLRRTRAHYDAERREYLADLQERLRKVADFEYGRASSRSASGSETP